MKPTLALDRFEVFAEGLDHPEGLAFDRDGNLWAGGELGQIYRIDPKRRVKVVATLGGFNLGLTFSNRQDLYVCNFKLGALIKIDRSGKVIRSWERVGHYRLRTPNFAVFDREGKKIVYCKQRGSFDVQQVKIRALSEGRAVVEGLRPGAVVALVNPEARASEKAKASNAGPAPGPSLK